MPETSPPFLAQITMSYVSLKILRTKRSLLRQMGSMKCCYKYRQKLTRVVKVVFAYRIEYAPPQPYEPVFKAIKKH